ncbi:DUF429 domain-containing protein [Kineococcus sp. SYSU DK004]|uniref:DUF429 domain-containing protein n=1 Tax=Kineococcus sp. SYSU DK004 TaxID=3383125 RepID=UPI003D7CCDD2
MITVGVDLATQPARTGLAVVEWSPGRARVAHLALGATDADVVAAAGAPADKVGIDCPLGWPDEFTAFVAAHTAGRLAQHVDTGPGADGEELRRRVAYRHTDRVLRRAGYVPLSVSTDRIGLTAVRAAVLLERLAAAGVPVDRSGTGVVAEVYPAASLHRWGLAHRGYKGREGASARAALVAGLLARTPWLDVGAHRALCEASDDALDALVAALAARAAALGRCASPAPGEVERARREGWIVLPEGQVGDLVDPA